MKSIDTSIACLDLSSVTQGYRALDVLTREGGLRILEASVTGAGRFVIVAAGAPEVLFEAVQRTREAVNGTEGAGLIDQEVIDSDAAPILQALYSLSQVPAEECVVVLECESMSGLLAMSQVLVSFHGLKAIELKQHRGSRSGGYGFFTGTMGAGASASEDARTRLKASLRKGDVVVISSPSRTFLEFFNFSGEA